MCQMCQHLLGAKKSIVVVDTVSALNAQLELDLSIVALAKLFPFPSEHWMDWMLEMWLNGFPGACDACIFFIFGLRMPWLKDFTCSDLLCAPFRMWFYTVCSLDPSCPRIASSWPALSQGNIKTWHEEMSQELRCRSTSQVSGLIGSTVVALQIDVLKLLLWHFVFLNLFMFLNLFSSIF